MSDEEARARAGWASHADKYSYPLCAASIRKGDDPYFNRVIIEAMLAYAALAAKPLNAREVEHPAETPEMRAALQHLPQPWEKKLASVHDEVWLHPQASYAIAICGPDPVERRNIARAIWVMLRRAAIASPTPAIDPEPNKPAPKGD